MPAIQTRLKGLNASFILAQGKKREKKRRGGWEKKKKTKTKKQAQPSHLPHSPTRIEPAEGAISAGSHGSSGEPLKPITVARASMLD